jgi:hypothetical protein
MDTQEMEERVKVFLLLKQHEIVGSYSLSSPSNFCPVQSIVEARNKQSYRWFLAKSLFPFEAPSIFFLLWVSF